MNNIDTSDIENFDKSLDSYQYIATKSAIYPETNSPIGLAYVALKLNGEAGEFAEHIGKAMRDDGLLSTNITDHRKELLIKEIGDVLWYLSAACNELGITLSHAAIKNLEKLQSRTTRGTLQGSGDDR